MAQKPRFKCCLDVGLLKTLMHEKGVSGRKMGKDPDFPYCAKTVERAIQTKKASVNVVMSLSGYFGVPFISLIEDRRYLNE